MKVSKSLLQAIALGVTMGTATSCGLMNNATDLHFDSCPGDCKIDHSNNHESSGDTYNCPACGMG